MQLAIHQLIPHKQWSPSIKASVAPPRMGKFAVDSPADVFRNSHIFVDFASAPYKPQCHQPLCPV
jgi:hypothetical protein